MTSVKRTVPELADFLAMLTGKGSIPAIARVLREAGRLSQAGYGRGAAAATSADAAWLVLMAMTGKPAAKAAKVANVFDTGRLIRKHLLEKPLAEVLETITQQSSPIDVLTVLIDRLRTQDARFGKDVVINMDPENPLGLKIKFEFERVGRTWTFHPENSSNVMFERAGVSTASGEAAFRTDTPKNLISRLADWLEGRDGGV